VPTDPITNSIGMSLVPVPAGEFLMGARDTDPGARDDEKPQHRVRITRPFYLGRYEVTQAEYARVMGASPSFFSRTGPGSARTSGQDPDRFPVEQASWHDAVEFCRRLSAVPAEGQAGRLYRLPTEAEWEYACRAGTTTAFHFGEACSSTQANFNGTDPYGAAAPGPFLLRTAAVGSYAPNAFGLYDMHGNVWEWCADWYGADYYKASPAEDPPGPAVGSSRVIRGGDWRAEGSDCRASFRNADMPAGRYYVTGFRVAMTAARPGAELPAAGSVPAPTPGEPPPPPGTGDGPSAGGAVALPAGEDWPRWRGPRGDGTWHGPRLPDHWPQGGPRRLWRQPVGGGHAGMVVAGARVYVTDHQKTPQERERVLCFDAATGRPAWSFDYPVHYGSLEYANGPRATPTVADGRVYTLGALGHLRCLDAATGKLVWSADLLRDYRARLPLWGFAASPLVFEGLLLVHAGAEPNGCLLALDRRTGKEVWRNLPDAAGYATPLLIESHGRAQLVCWTPTNVRGLEPGTGKLLWTVPFEVTYGTAIATPVFAEGVVLVSGYWEGAKGIRLGGDGAAAVVWENRRDLRALMSQPLCRGGYAYLLDKRSGLTCLALKTGKKVWDDGNRMTPKGRNPQATLVWLGDGDRALVLNSDGDLILARLNPGGYHEQARAHIIGPTWAHPAYAGGCVYARNDSEVVCVLLTAGGAARAAGPAIPDVARGR
jgi:formylglycine-generating enzyme required for sulfatase activity/outer membrane protein assembly factor BamB